MISMVSSFNERCGITDYTNRLCDSFLAKEGVDFARIPFKEGRGSDVVKRALLEDPRIVHIQLEQSVIEPGEIITMLKLLRNWREMQPERRVFMTLHYADEGLFARYGEYLDSFIVHKPPYWGDHKAIVVPIGAPVWPEKQVVPLRDKYGFARNDVIISTAGFLSTWKQFDLVVDHVSHILKEHEGTVFQMITPVHGSMGDTVSVHDRVKQIIDTHKIDKQVRMVDQYVSLEEMNERLQLSDLGILYANRDTGSCSAAGREFVAARLPTVITDSTHFWDWREGTIRSGQRIEDFMQSIAWVLENREILPILRQEAETLYNKVNFDRVAEAHLAIYEDKYGGCD